MLRAEDTAGGGGEEGVVGVQGSPGSAPEGTQVRTEEGVVGLQGSPGSAPEGTQVKILGYSLHST